MAVGIVGDRLGRPRPRPGPTPLYRFASEQAGLSYKRQDDEERDAVLDALAAHAQELGMGY